MTLVITKFNSFILQVQNLRQREKNSMPETQSSLAEDQAQTWAGVPFTPHSQKGIISGFKPRSSNSKNSPSTQIPHRDRAEGAASIGWRGRRFPFFGGRKLALKWCNALTAFSTKHGLCSHCFTQHLFFTVFRTIILPYEIK